MRKKIESIEIDYSINDMTPSDKVVNFESLLTLFGSAM